MKIFYFLIVNFLWFNILSNAQNVTSLQRSTNNTVRHKVIITGMIADSTKGKENSVWLQYFDYSLPSGNRIVFIDSIVTNNACFQFQFSIDHPVYVNLFSSNREVQSESYFIKGTSAYGVLGTYFTTHGAMVEPGDSIHMDLRKASTFLTTTFSGRGSEKLRCIQEILRNTTLYECPPLLNSNETPRIAQADSIKNMILNTINIFRHKLTPTASKIITTHYIFMLSPDISQIVQTLNYKDVKIKNLYFKKIAESKRIIDPSDSVLIYGGVFVNSILTKRALLELAMDGNFEYQSISNWEFDKRVHQALIKYVPKGLVKERIIGDYLLNSISDFGCPNDLENTIIQYLSKKSKNSIYYQVLKKKYEHYKIRLVPGSDGYAFELPDTTGRIVRLSDFKGKVVLLDFMFKGCQGCATMVPYLEKIEELFHGKNVVFLSISLDRNIQEWKQAIGVYSSSRSIQLYTNGQAINHPLPRFYNIPGGPFLVLFDKEGKLISLRAPDPRRDEGKGLSDMINKAL